VRKSGKGISNTDFFVVVIQLCAFQLLIKPIAFQAELAARDADMAALQEQADHLQSQLQASNGQLHDARRAEEASLERMRRDAEQHAADMAAVKVCPQCFLCPWLCVLSSVLCAY